ncbi:MAG TPA: nuclear transport factor 2 family protein [Microlunatus sp.]
MTELDTGPRADLEALEQVWDAHTAAEFVTTDLDATMATMSENPVVLHVATSVGACGREAVRRFYAEYFIGHQAADMSLERTSRTVTADRVVDEMIISFTHDVEIPWIMPGVAPTGRRVVVGIVTVIGMSQGLVDSEHIYWDQASVLAQVGLLEPTGLPVVGAEQVLPLGRGAGPETFNALLS